MFSGGGGVRCGCRETGVKYGERWILYGVLNEI